MFFLIRNEKLEMRNWACALEFNVELDLRQKSKELFPFHFPFHFSFLICHFKNFVIFFSP